MCCTADAALVQMGCLSTGSGVTSVSIGCVSEDRVLVTFMQGDPQLWRPGSQGQATQNVPFVGSGNSRVHGAIERSGRFILLASERGVVAVYRARDCALLDVIKVCAILSLVTYLFATVPHPHGHWQLQELLGNQCYHYHHLRLAYLEQPDLA